MLIICPIASVGSELTPFTVAKPKTLIKVAGARIIDHIMSQLKAKFPPKTKICFIVGYKKRTIISYLKENYGDYFNLLFEEQPSIGLRNDIPLFSGIGDAIQLAGKHGKGDDCFIFFSDHLPTQDFSCLFQRLEDSQDGASENNLDHSRPGALDGVINVRHVDNPNLYGVCLVDERGIVRKVVEKPTAPVSNLAITWGYVFSKRITPRLFELLDRQAQEPLLANKLHEFTTILEQLIEEGAKFGVNIMDSPILDFGQVSDFLEGNRFLLEHYQATPGDAVHKFGEISIEKVIHSSIIPPVYFGKNCAITNSVVGPNVSIGENTILHNCVLSNSVVGDCSSLENVITENSIIGDFVTLEYIVKKSISIGDSSNIATSNNQ